MALSINKNVDLMTLATKGDLIGCFPHFIEDDVEVLREVIDYEFSLATDQICLEFVDGSKSFFMLKEKHKVSTVVLLTRVNTGKIKQHKK